MFSVQLASSSFDLSYGIRVLSPVRSARVTNESRRGLMTAALGDDGVKLCELGEMPVGDRFVDGRSQLLGGLALGGLEGWSL